MRHKAIMYLLAIMTIIAGCTAEDIFYKEHQVRIEGNQRQGFWSEETNSRAAVSQLATGSEISFYSKGAMSCEGEVLKYDGTEWNGSRPLFWNEASGNAEVHAYYPVLDQGSPSFYDENSCLKDVLCADGSYAVGEKIYLSFSHLFPELVFTFSPTINNAAELIKFRISKKIAAMDMYSAALTLQDNTDEIVFQRSNDSIYRFQVPYSETPISIDITVTTAGGERKTSVAKDFRKGVSYRCHITEQNQSAPGIYTAQDFIDFITLYNGDIVEGRSIEEFYDAKENEGGKRVFRLMNSLTFTPQESVQIKGIGLGKGADRIFSDVFDGMNHTLSDIVFQDFRSGGVGLFIKNKGVIRNVCIDNMTIDIKGKVSKALYAANLCYSNHGTIHNCKVMNSKVNNNNRQTCSSFLVYHNQVTMYNNGVENCSTNCTNTGGCVYNNVGIIMNSYSYNNSMKNGGLLCFDNSGSIYLGYSFTINKNVSPVSVKKTNTVKELDCFVQNDLSSQCIVHLPYKAHFSYVRSDFSGVNMDYKNGTDVFKGTLVEALNHCITKDYDGVAAGIVLSSWTAAPDGHPIFSSAH